MKDAAPGDERATPALELRGLSKRYAAPGGAVAAVTAVTALEDVSLTVARGEIFGIIGPSGAGKTTLLRCLNLLERPDRGSVHLGGEELTALDEPALRRARRRVGMVFQHFRLLARRDVRRNVALPLELAGVAPAAIAARVSELLDRVGLADKAAAYPAQLSGGQQQRVGIARALANAPEVLLCDEATSALDPVTTGQILELLGDLRRELGLTVVLITHEMAVIERIADRVAVLEAGRVVEVGRVAELFAAPQSGTARRFVAGLAATRAAADAPPAAASLAPVREVVNHG